MRITVDNEPDMEYISKHLKVLLEQNKEAEIYITQGFICRNAYGSIDNLERGGSDYTASLIGAAIQKRYRYGRILTECIIMIHGLSMIPLLSDN